MKSSVINFIVVSLLVVGCSEPPRDDKSNKKNRSKKISVIAQSNGKYVCSEGTHMVVNRDKAGEWEEFTIVFLDSNKINLKTYLGKYVCADLSNNAVLCSDRDVAQGWETFNFEILKNGKIALKASNNKYICCEPVDPGILVANSDSIREWETFEVIHK